ncbi:hypothetical protein HQ394_09470 [Defluviicoccus vanus]|uniref:Uncharacterized protein n=2 Tax=Defluviicoccus vanus TaxID=111831 RepID=A0A7H1N1D3_9PROT|nr:hypothetical protein [Defluviicoccus vanus]QNT69519.1 hypothetical protein HQ394_09470 [Defluviicoccus vanus]
MRGGDPLSLVDQTLKLRGQDQERAGRHVRSVLLIDTDRLEDGSERSREAIELAQRSELVLIRQRPCFEGVLLRLHADHSQTFPHYARDAEHRLIKTWPSYRKPVNRQQLASRFQLSDLVQAAQADTEICTLLQILELPTNLP